jgi:hypothetical protein
LAFLFDGEGDLGDDGDEGNFGDAFGGFDGVLSKRTFFDDFGGGLDCLAGLFAFCFAGVLEDFTSCISDNNK